MAITVGDMSPEELRRLLEETVERKLRELLGIEEDEADISEQVRSRLMQQLEAVQAGERGLSMDEVASALDQE